MKGMNQVQEEKQRAIVAVVGWPACKICSYCRQQKTLGNNSVKYCWAKALRWECNPGANMCRTCVVEYNIILSAYVLLLNQSLLRRAAPHCIIYYLLL